MFHTCSRFLLAFMFHIFMLSSQELFCLKIATTKSWKRLSWKSYFSPAPATFVPLHLKPALVLNSDFTVSCSQNIKRLHSPSVYTFLSFYLLQICLGQNVLDEIKILLLCFLFTSSSSRCQAICGSSSATWEIFRYRNTRPASVVTAWKAKNRWYENIFLPMKIFAATWILQISRF